MEHNFFEVLRTNPAAFAAKAHLEVYGTRLTPHPYIRLILNDVLSVLHCVRNKYSLATPPGHLKTFLLSTVLPALELAHNPASKILIITNAEPLSKSISYNLRKVAESEWYCKTFPRTKISADHRSVLDFATRAGGRMFATTIHGQITGRRADLIICDDVSQIKQFNDDAHFAEVSSIFESEIVSRLDNPVTGRIVNVQHRLHPKDLTGYLQTRGDFYFRKLALVAEHDEDFPLSTGEVWHRKKCEVLRPDAFPPEVVAALRKTTAGPGFGPLYQQSFGGADDLHLTARDFRLITLHDVRNLLTLISVDPAQKAGGASYSVVQVWSIVENIFVLIDQWRRRASYDELASALRMLVRRYQPNTVLIEANGFGFRLPDVIRDAKAELVCPTRSKQERLRAVLPMFREGRVGVRRSMPFGPEFFDEIDTFPRGMTDDQIDAMTQALEWLTGHVLSRPAARPMRCVAVRPNTQLRGMQSYRSRRL